MKPGLSAITAAPPHPHFPPLIRWLRESLSFADTSRIRWKLFVRLSLAAVVLSLSLGGVALVYQLEHIDKLLVTNAQLESTIIARLVTEDLTPGSAGKQEMEARLAEFSKSRHRAVRGHFIQTQLQAPDRTELASLGQAGIHYIERAFGRVQQTVQDEGAFSYKKIRLYDQVYIRVLLPIRNGNQRLLGYFRGIYRADPAQVAEVKNSVFAIVSFVIISVLATTYLLYPLIIRMHRRLLRSSHELLAANLESLDVLGSSIAKRDSDTHQHNHRVVLYSVRLAEAIGLDAASIRPLIKGAFLHDVGKIGVSDLILLKPGKLDEQEFETMKTHVQHGVDILANAPWLREAVDVVHCHHEKFDGSGYPRGLSGEQIPLTARIFAIVDVFDALTSERPYKKAFSLEKTMKILDESRGSHFDPALLDVFRNMAGKLYQEYAGRDDDGVERAMNEVVSRHFIL